MANESGSEESFSDVMEWVKKGFSFDGGIERGQFFAYWIFAVLLAVLLPFLAGIFGAVGPDGNVAPIVTLLILFPAFISSFWVTLAAYVKRFRDAGLSYWWFLLMFIPLGGAVVFIMATFANSRPPRQVF